MKANDIITRFITLSDPVYFAAAASKILLITVLLWMIHQYRPHWKNFANFFLFILLIRVLLFGEYFSWGFYGEHLGTDDVGWRQKSVLDFEYKKFFKNTQKINYFAVGSSQTLALYTHYAKEHQELSVMHLSSMTTLDLFLYKKFIAARKPDHILLYLSEFDMTKPPELNASKLAPAQGIGLLPILPMLYEISKETHSEIALNEMITGEFFPEYKYAFIFRGFTEKIMRKNASLHLASLLDALHPDAEGVRKNIEDMSRRMDKRWIKYNDYFLTKFLSYCKDHSIKVIIVEGQYNPLAYTEKNLSLNQVTRLDLESLAKKYDNVVFLPRSSVTQFIENDYSDVTHVKTEPAYHFVESLIRKISS